jgi:hypothetical protein
VSTPVAVVVEDWSDGTARDAGRIDFDRALSTHTFGDAALARDCTGWTRYGPSESAALPDTVDCSQTAVLSRWGGFFFGFLIAESDAKAIPCALPSGSAVPQPASVPAI